MIIFTLITITTPILLIYIDKLIEKFSPEGNLSSLSEEMDDIMISTNDKQNNCKP